MDNVIDFGKHLEIKNGPDSSCIKYDESGNRLFLYSFLYRHNDRTLELEFWCKDLEEAQSLLEDLRNTLKYNGQIVAIDY